MGSSGTIRAHRSRALNATLAALALLVFAHAVIAPAWAEPGNDNRAPVFTGDLAKLNVDAGHRVAFIAYAEGVQIYRWDGPGAGWVFQRPEAVLYTEDGQGLIGIHYEGPKWESASGSIVTGSVVERATPDTNAIQWLKLSAAKTEGHGIFEGVTFIQRLNTTAGKAPTAPGDFVGQEAEVPYTADYYFYRKQGQ